MKKLPKHGIYYTVIFLILAVIVIFPACNTGNVQSQTFKWRMATSWTTDDLLYKDAAVAICNRVSQLSSGRLAIQAYPAGELTGAFEVLDSVSKGEIECGHSWSGYSRDKEPGFLLFSSIPNMMTMQEWSVWLYGPTKGIELWRELYSKYNVVPFPGALNGPEFGFFTSTPVRTAADFKGLKIRTVGIGADVLKELGATPVVIPQGQIKEALQKGELDGFEFNTPVIDWNLGFDSSIAPYVTLPSWHQPSGMYETVVNKDAWNKLPDDLKNIFESACKEVAMVDFTAQIEGANPEYLAKYQQGGIQIFVLDEASMNEITRIADKLCDDYAARDAFFAKVLKSQRDFRASYRTWEQWDDYKIYPAK